VETLHKIIVTVVKLHTGLIKETVVTFLVLREESDKCHNDISVVGLWRCTPNCGEAHEHASRHDTCAGSKCWKPKSLELYAPSTILETALAREMRASWTTRSL
jgi:hypothetical protein